MIRILVKILRPGVQPPTKAHPTDSGWDCYVAEDVHLDPHNATLVPLGIAVELPAGYELQGRPRSSSLLNKGLHVQFGTVDNGYRGELMAVVMNMNDFSVTVHAGDRILQLVPMAIEPSRLFLVDELTPSPRGDRGFGSTGR